MLSVVDLSNIEFLKRNPDTSYLALENQMVIGAIMCGHDGRRGMIYHTVVKEEKRGRGIGRRLVEAAMYALEKEGIHKVGLLVFGRNEIGNKFWEKMGFTERTSTTDVRCSFSAGWQKSNQ